MTTMPSEPPSDRRPAEELVVHLRRPEDLVVTRPLDAMDDDGPVRAVPGADELLGELLARPHPRRRRRVVLTLPTVEAGTDARLAAALRRWCHARMVRTERERRTFWRQGLWSLRGGLVLFVVGLVASTDFLDPEVPPFLQELLGNGVFLVIAWVGLWYPLDLLCFARSPAKREMRALETLSAMPVEVRTRGARAPGTTIRCQGEVPDDGR